jgi:rhomboid protease GluP
MNTAMKSWVTWVLIAMNVAMFGVEIATGADPIQPLVKDIVHLGGNFGPLTLGHHEWWRVVASMFLHYGVLHIGMNMLCLWQARGVEEMYGHGGFAAIYIVSGLLGGVGSLARGGLVVSAGASGAVFGVFGAFGAYLLRARHTSDPAAWAKTAQRLGTFIALNMIIGLQSKGIDITAHIVGLITGFAAGYAMPKIKALPVLGIGVALSIAGLLALPAPFDVDALLADFHEVEHKCITTYNDKLHEQQANKLDRLGFADAVEKEVLPPWHALRVRIDAVTDDQLPPRLHPLFATLRRYAHDREEAWTELVKVNRDLAPADTYHADEEKTRADIRALDADLNALK